jgi:hypothetical protein
MIGGMVTCYDGGLILSGARVAGLLRFSASS